MQTKDTRENGAPTFGAPDRALFIAALRDGWRDFSAAPAFGLLAASLCLIAGWSMAALTIWAGHTFWLVLGVFGFPMAAPFAALGTYEVSRLRGMGQAASLRDVLHTLWAERQRQLPWLCALMMVMLLFWFFMGHMIFALFLGLKPMTNIMSSGQVFLSSDGLMMLVLGSTVGGGFALLLFAICVVGLPMLLDRQVDYVTAMIRSISLVATYPVQMLLWAAFIAALLLLAMLPAFLGLLLVLPWLGHTSWHVYDKLKANGYSATSRP